MFDKNSFDWKGANKYGNKLNIKQSHKQEMISLSLFLNSAFLISAPFAKHLIVWNFTTILLSKRKQEDHTDVLDQKCIFLHYQNIKQASYVSPLFLIAVI